MFGASAVFHNTLITATCQTVKTYRLRQVLVSRCAHWSGVVAVRTSLQPCVGERRSSLPLAANEPD